MMAPGTTRIPSAILIAAALLMGAASIGCSSDAEDDFVPTCPSTAPAPEAPPKNPFLADSAYPLGHTDSAQQDSTTLSGPDDHDRTLAATDFAYRQIGPGHFGNYISTAYPDSRRVLWTNGTDRIVKLDYETFDVIDSFPIPGADFWSDMEMEQAIADLSAPTSGERLISSFALGARMFADLSSVYALLDIDGNFYVGGGRTVTLYRDAIADDPDSDIVAADSYQLPAMATGLLVGMNISFDGWLIFVTEHGWVVAVARDFSQEHVIRMLHSENAEAYTDMQTQSGRGWMRNGYAVDDDGGIYIVSLEHMHKVVWLGDGLSTNESDGAWTAPMRNGRGLGSGATPALMGFGSEDRFVVITDGDELMNVTLYWRDEIPADWDQLRNAPDRRVAGFLPADMGPFGLETIQSEQSVVVAGYGALVVNNQPPDSTGDPASVALQAGFLGSSPEYTPHGVQKFAWDPAERVFREHWANVDVASPNSVPYVSLGSSLVYTVGTRDGLWTLEALDWCSGASAYHWVVGGERYNSLFAGVFIDEEGRINYGTSFGVLRLDPN